jgi:hypothetical protein
MTSKEVNDNAVVKWRYTIMRYRTIKKQGRGRGREGSYYKA